jgi:hypothetical protein
MAIQILRDRSGLKIGEIETTNNGTQTIRGVNGLYLVH